MGKRLYWEKWLHNSNNCSDQYVILDLSLGKKWWQLAIFSRLSIKNRKERKREFFTRLPVLETRLLTAVM
jgi:hypothetical protein